MRTMISYQCETLEEAQAVLAAVDAIGKAPHACSKQYFEASEIGAKVPGEKVDNESLVEDAHPTPTPSPSTIPRKNVSPGTPAITKIGSATADLILGELKRGRQPLSTKYTEHLKLLWKRGEVKFDGKEYYL